MGNVTTTVSGNVASFMSPYEVPIRSMKVHFSPTQEGQGDPSPSNIRPINGWNGVNVYHDKKTVIWNNLIEGYFSSTDWKDRNSSETTTTFEDGIATVQFLNTLGSYHTMMTKNSHYTYNGHKYYYRFQCMLNKTIDGGVGVEAANIQTYPGMNAGIDEWGEYSGTVIGRQDRNSYLYVPRLGNNDSIPEGVIAKVKNVVMIDLTKMYGAGNEPTRAAFEAECVLNGIDLNSTFHINYAGTEIPWKTLDTVEIPITFQACGKNLFNIYEMATRPGITRDGTTFIGTASSIRCNLGNGVRKYPCYIPAGTTFTTSCTAYSEGQYQSGDGWCIYFVYDDGTDVRPFYTKNSTLTPTSYSGTITAEKNIINYYFTWFMAGSTNVWHVTDFQVEIGDTATSYEYYKDTCYGGYIDLIKGEVIAEWDFYTFTGNEKFYNNNTWISTYLNKVAATPYNGICSHYPYGPYGRGKIGVMYNEGACIFDGNIRDAEGWKQYCKEQYDNSTPIQIAYKLKDPITYSLTSQQLNTLKGNNAIWSNTNDITEVEYDFTETADIRQVRKRMMLNTPHVKEISSSIVNFNTNMNANLKECKTYFTPKQEGSGTPSPDNIRPIVGTNEITIYHGGKNLIHIVGYSASNITTPTHPKELTNNYGTTIDTVNFNYPDSAVVITQANALNDTIHSVQNGYIVIIDDNLQFNKTYNVSFRVTDIISNPLNARLDQLRIASPNGSYNAVFSVVGDRVIFKNVDYGHHPVELTRHGFEIRICGMSFTLSEFMVTAADDNDITFEPYQTISEIPITFPYVGKNIGNWLTPDGYTFTTNYNGYSGWSNAFECGDKIGTTYTYSVYFDNTEGSTEAFPHVWTLKNDGTYNRVDIVPSSSTFIQPGQVGRCHCTFTILNGDASMHCGVTVSPGCIASKPMLELGNTLSDYEPCTNIIYGGYVDLVKGEVVQEWVAVHAKDLKWSNYSNYKVFYLSGSGVRAIDALDISDKLQSHYGYGWDNAPDNSIISGISANLFIKHEGVTSDAEFRAWLEEVDPIIAYKPVTPITYQLTPQQLKSLKGINNIWLDTNDAIEVKYWTH